MHDVILLCCMAGIFGAMEGLEHLAAHQKTKAKRLLWLVACLSHPVTFKTVEEFIVHIVIYSGKMIP